MISLNDAFYRLKNGLAGLYDPGEGAAIAHQLLEWLTGKGRLERLDHKNMLLTGDQWERLQEAQARLLRAEPLQYIIGAQWFLGRKFAVSKEVLIPRPETEELVQWILDDNRDRQELKLLDIGTGSGCIAVSLQAARPDWKVIACDISPGALAVAAANAATHSAAVSFRELNFLEERHWKELDIYDIIISNPPYIPEAYREGMDRNVAEHEPAVALFVPDNDPLLFYRKIAAFGKDHMARDGSIYCELHLDHAGDTAALFIESGYNDAVLRKDMNGNDRMLRAGGARRMG